MKTVRCCPGPEKQPTTQDLKNENAYSLLSHLDFSARWIHDFDVAKRVEGNGFNFTASLKF
jgi:hypothetical protein